MSDVTRQERFTYKTGDITWDDDFNPESDDVDKFDIAQPRGRDGRWIHGSGGAGGAHDLTHEQHRPSSAAISAVQHGSEGFSVHPYSGDTPKSGYMVAMNDKTHTFPASIMSDKKQVSAAIRSVLDKESSTFAKGDVYLGGWVHDGKLWIEPSQNIADHDEAVKTATHGNQIAIWDVAHGQEIQTGGSGGGRITEHDTSGAVVRSYQAKYQRLGAGEQDVYEGSGSLGVDDRAAEAGLLRYAGGEDRSGEFVAKAGYSLSPRSGMISLDLRPGTIPVVPGGVDDHHITIAYLGRDVDDDSWNEAVRTAHVVAAETPPLFGTIHGIDTFPEGEDGIPAWAHVNVPGVQELHDQLSHLQSPDAVATNSNGYVPHVTLAYLEDENPPAPVPETPVYFPELSVHRGDDVVRIPFGGPAQKYELAVKAGSAQVLQDYWEHHAHGGPTHFAGADEIAWGTPGDFDRCVTLVSEHMSPEHAKGYCNLRHHGALGYWPAQHAQMERGKNQSPDIAKVGPKGYIHGWIKVGAEAQSVAEQKLSHNGLPDAAHKIIATKLAEHLQQVGPHSDVANSLHEVRIAQHNGGELRGNELGVTLVDHSGKGKHDMLISNAVFHPNSDKIASDLFEDRELSTDMPLLDHVMAHEFGHVLHLAEGEPKIQHDDRFPTSTYGKSSHLEEVAESYAAHAAESKGYHTTHPDTMVLKCSVELR